MPVSPGALMLLWMVLVILLYGLLWLAGFQQRHIAEAVEAGAALLESRSIGEMSEQSIRDSLEDQRDTRRFWTVVLLIGNFCIEPLVLPLRALTVAVAFSAWAALMGRPAAFHGMWAVSAVWQGLWVLAVATQAGAVLLSGNHEVNTSIAMFLPDEIVAAHLWLIADNVHPLALFGWIILSWKAWRLRQANWFMAMLIGSVLLSLELLIRVSCGIVVGASMRLTLIPA